MARGKESILVEEAAQSGLQAARIAAARYGLNGGRVPKEDKMEEFTTPETGECYGLKGAPWLFWPKKGKGSVWQVYVSEATVVDRSTSESDDDGDEGAEAAPLTAAEAKGLNADVAAVKALYTASKAAGDKAAKALIALAEKAEALKASGLWKRFGGGFTSWATFSKEALGFEDSYLRHVSGVVSKGFGGLAREHGIAKAMFLSRTELKPAEAVAKLEEAGHDINTVSVADIRKTFGMKTGGGTRKGTKTDLKADLEGYIAGLKTAEAATKAVAFLSGFMAQAEAKAAELTAVEAASKAVVEKATAFKVAAGRDAIESRMDKMEQNFSSIAQSLAAFLKAQEAATKK